MKHDGVQGIGRCWRGLHYVAAKIGKYMRRIFCKTQMPQEIPENLAADIRVQVLLSSYNGEKYIAEQIESIQRQQGVKAELLIRDDGSADRTLEIIQDYAENNSNICYYKGRNIGVQHSFFDLMAHADRTADYYAFADQDDVWLPDKLQRAVSLLQGCADADRPLLYAGGLIYADEMLQHLKLVVHKRRKEASFGNALIENICTGCTEVFNGKLLEMAAAHRPQCEILHDWWMYLTASCFGQVLYDQAAYIYYRQHDKNVVGMSGCRAGRWMRRLHHRSDLRGIVSRQTKDFCRAYRNLGSSRALACEVLSYKKSWRHRIGILFEKRIYRQDWIDDLIYRVLFLLGFL